MNKLEYLVDLTEKTEHKKLICEITSIKYPSIIILLSLV